jgi:hypothetical protein
MLASCGRNSRTTGNLSFVEHGAQHLPGAAFRHLDALRSFCATLAQDRAGVRLAGVEPLSSWLRPNGALGQWAQGFGRERRPVRALLFDKTPLNNWALDWHQDRMIVVRRRVEVKGFGPWTRKSGMQHVEPPFEIIGGMVTIRIHLDAVDEGNAPLLVAPGSHRLGRIPVPQVAGVVERCGVHACLAGAGDVWAYATPILHGSNAAVAPVHRRVLQVDYAAGSLPGGLEWLGV